MKKIIYLSFLIGTKIFSQTGINTPSPTNMLHIKGNGTSDALRIEGLRSGASNLENLVSTSNGVVKRQDFNTVSAVQVSGNLDMPLNNSFYPTNATSTPVKAFDNLNEFSGNSFTASQAGLYFITLTVSYPQRLVSLDSGDGYLAEALIIFPTYYEENACKIFTPESSLSAASQNVQAKSIAKLNAGDTVDFETLVYGTTGNLTGITYKINIVRID